MYYKVCLTSIISPEFHKNIVLIQIIISRIYRVLIEYEGWPISEPVKLTGEYGKMKWLTAWNKSNGMKSDPWSGRNKENGPPDLDQILRNVVRKFRQSNSKKPEGFDGGNGGLALPGTVALAALFIILFIVWAVSGIYIVAPAEQAVILRFGQYQGTVGPGPHWLPRFIDKQYTVNVEQIIPYQYKAEMLTNDENIVFVEVNVQYRIQDPKDYLFSTVSPHESLRQATASALRQVVGHTTLDETLTKGRTLLRQQVDEQLKEILDIYKTGIMVVDVAMNKAEPPEAVMASYNDAIKAQEDERRYKRQASSYANKIIPIAEGGAARIMQEADAYKQKVVFGAKADTARFLALMPEYHRAPRVLRDRMYIDTIEGMLSKVSKVLVDTKNNNNLMYLPIDKLINRQSGIKSPVDSEKISDEMSKDALAQATDNASVASRSGRFDDDSRSGGR